MAAKAGEERFVFEAEWFDAQASLIRKYLFTYYPTDRTIEMVQFILYFYAHPCETMGGYFLF
jgi:hypothetical protein